ncbi:MAG: uracil-DNA glycosylase [Thermoguttaceae bacterium]|nr:uracil-DNA glycosylase [Thermoguttaceae bacterium]MDW8077625.1 uracil-DNA glycosylase family protein [Thermoguttaceae bacterium]
MQEQFEIRKLLRQIFFDLRLAGVTHVPANFFAPSPAGVPPKPVGESKPISAPEGPSVSSTAEPVRTEQIVRGGRETSSALGPGPSAFTEQGKMGTPLSSGEQFVSAGSSTPTAGGPALPEGSTPSRAEPQPVMNFSTLTLPVWAQEDGANILSAEEKRQRLAELSRRVSQCKRCPELVRNRTQTVFADGSPESKLVFVGEAPGAEEDKQGLPFVGRAGQLLTDIITKGMGLRREDVYICNVIKCRPPENRTPTPTEVANCREYLEEQLTLVRPRFICCLGSVAAQRILGSKQSMTKLRGQVFTLGCVKVVCTYHPAYLLRNPEAKRETWEDIKLLMREMGLSPPPSGRARR